MRNTLLGALHTSPAAFADEFRLAGAVKLYEMGRVSQGQAARLAGMSRADFIDALGQFGVSPFQTTPEELKDEYERGESS